MSVPDGRTSGATLFHVQACLSAIGSPGFRLPQVGQGMIRLSRRTKARPGHPAPFEAQSQSASDSRNALAHGQPH